MEQSHYNEIHEAIEQFKVSKDFAFIDENPRMERFYELAINALEKQMQEAIKYEKENNNAI
jgi:predicted DNA-binding WGR domain protein